MEVEDVVKLCYSVKRSKNVVNENYAGREVENSVFCLFDRSKHFFGERNRTSVAFRTVQRQIDPFEISSPVRGSHLLPITVPTIISSLAQQ